MAIEQNQTFDGYLNSSFIYLSTTEHFESWSIDESRRSQNGAIYRKKYSCN